MVLLRFAPSPTGALHLGGLRMALYNHLYAKKLKGKWIMRVEDTDASRSVPGAVDGIRKVLQWAGLDYNFGPGKDGPHAPYYQSERLDLYRHYAGKLIDSGHAYRCFCSEDQLQQTREKLARSGSNSTYDKRCLHLTEEEIARKVRAGEKSIVRLNDSNLPIRPPATDLVFGHLKDAHASLATDPILLKSDLFPTYHLACVVDDHEMGITHILRGEEWLPSLPLHLDLYASLKISPPQFAHIPILLNPDGTKMSKRKGDVQVVNYMQRGWEPVAILNWLALAGWGAQYEAVSPENTSTSRLVHRAPDSTTVMSLQELINEFDLSAITQRSSSLDPGKLEYLNKHHLKRIWSTPKGLESLAKRVHIQIKTQFPKSEYTTIDYIKQVILLLEGRLASINDIPLHAKYLFEEPDFESEEAQGLLAQISTTDVEVALYPVLEQLEAVPGASWDQADFMSILRKARSGVDMSMKPFMKILRYALSGTRDGPAVPDIIRILGRDRTIERLEPLIILDRKGKVAMRI